MEAVSQKKATLGGHFLIQDTQAADVFIPEDFNEEQKMIASMCRDFVVAEVYPNIDKLDKMVDPSLMPSLLDKAGEQGLLGISIPEEYGGFGKDFTTGMLTNEILGAAHCFSVALLAHCGIGTLPILYFGNDAQKAKYLPKLATGEWKACYCLTEPGSGSDALGAKTKAVLNPEGTHYIINGQKMWITNAGFADVMVVFAKIDGEHFTGFIVERAWEGISMNPEEQKMGIKGSSTRQVFFTDVKVPVENLLGEIGKGHRIAFNILNVGRIKLAAATTGSSKKVIEAATKYANERKQFNRSISSFGAIQDKISRMIIETYASESATYRASENISQLEEKLQHDGLPYAQALLGAAEEYNVECAILKVFGSETLDMVVDEGVQTFGGYGFSAEFPMDRAYRDSRINRIYEGTNEINLMLTTGTLIKRAMQGKLDLISAAMKAQQELAAAEGPNPYEGQAFAYEKQIIANQKKLFLITAGAALQKFQAGIDKEQEILMNTARIAMNTYVAESLLLRVERLVAAQGAGATSLQVDILGAFVHDAVDRNYILAKNSAQAFAEGDFLKGLLSGIRKLTKTADFNLIAARRRIAAVAIEADNYPL